MNRGLIPIWLIWVPVLLVLQVTWIARVTGAETSPDFLLFLSLYGALVFPRRWALLPALVLGFLADTLSFLPMGLTSVSYLSGAVLVLLCTRFLDPMNRTVQWVCAVLGTFAAQASMGIALSVSPQWSLSTTTLAGLGAVQVAWALFLWIPLVWLLKRNPVSS
ncbi:MAG: rod shape-determining protein MreD [Candidatus Omnitrophica bacterium]|nr:rod shape-determining protein MreD [Candidatus Omnitrophota bacterium]